MDKKEQARLRKQRQRDKERDIKECDTLSVTGISFTDSETVSPVWDVAKALIKDSQEMVPASYVYGVNGRKYQTLPERPRFLTLTKGKILDRANLPTAQYNLGDEMLYCNE